MQASNTFTDARSSHTFQLHLSEVVAGVVGLGVVVCVAPRTALSLPFETLLAWAQRGAGVQDGGPRFDSDRFAYLGGYLLLVCLLAFYGAQRMKRRVPLPVARFGDAMGAFSALFLLDPFVSVARDLSYANRWWGFWALSAFWMVALFVHKRHALWLLKFVVCVIGLQAIYAVVFYGLGVNQLHGTRFGNRTGGTFGNPNILYPLCLMAIPLGFVLGEAHSGEWRWALRVVGGLSAFALLLTFTRAGWLALLGALLFLTFSHSSPFSMNRTWRAAVLIAAIVLLLGVVFVRTRGKFIGTHWDSSFWGRIYIWQTAARAASEHPIFGSGVGTYALQQRKFMTPRLEKFRPSNLEAKSLPLNIAVEFGLMGLALLA